MSNDNYIISGIIPAAGHATRLGKLPFSKELYPIDVDKARTKVVSSHLLEAMTKSGVDQIHIVIRDGKWDIPAYYGSKYRDKPVCYHIAEYGYGVPFTVNQAYSFVKDNIVILGFPDILFEPKNAYQRLIDELMKSDTSIALGIFPVSKPEKWDVVQLDNDNMVEKIEIKPKNGHNKNAWVIAAWKPEFSVYLNTFIESSLKEKTNDELTNSELHFGDAIISAMQNGIKVKGVIFSEGKCLDTGTPAEMKMANKFI